MPSCCAKYDGILHTPEQSFPELNRPLLLAPSPIVSAGAHQDCRRAHLVKRPSAAAADARAQPVPHRSQ
eukprot:5203234-Pleurochrysis_carterae.AAC.1